MAEAAHIVSQMEVDFIDINMGCPVPKILKSGAGSALLRDIGLAKEVMAAVVNASKVPVTVKIRLGWDAKSIVAVDLALAAESTGIAAVSIHGRTKAQAFSDDADWSMIKTVKESVGIPAETVMSVDTRCEENAERNGLRRRHVGRAIQGNPWIFREAETIPRNGCCPLLLRPPKNERRSCSGIWLRWSDSSVKTGAYARCGNTFVGYKGLQGGAEFRTMINHLNRHGRDAT